MVDRGFREVKQPQPSEQRVVTRPNSFIFTLFGDFVHRDPHSNDEIWVGALIRLMGEFGLSAQAVRQSISRISRQGWLVARRERNRSYYALTEQGRGRVEAISPRIYGPVVDWDGRWRLLTYSVSESRREARDRLRKDLTVLGWAPLSASTWVSPNGTLQAARAAAQSSELLECVDLFVGDYAGPSRDRQLLERCWDLPLIAKHYVDFTSRYEGALRTERGSRALSDDAAFVQRMWLVHDYRKFAYVDPGLPSALLPAPWPGTAAAAVFREYYALLATKAQRHYEAAQLPS